MNIYDIKATSIDGEPRELEAYRGRVLLIVNVASRCAFTGQYAGLEALYRKYRDRGLLVLGFPCDQFGHQEPDGEADIKQFCSLKYDVSFPMFAKVNVNGDDAHPLYQFLKSAKRGLLGSSWIKWNFTKFLVDRAGKVVERYGPLVPPERLEKAIETLVSEPEVLTKDDGNLR
jgi:glutathione peroxidase